MSYFLILLIYLLAAYWLFLIAKKLKGKWAWLAWLPVASNYLVVRLAKKPFYFLILMYIPLLNIYYDFILWREIFKRYNRNWLYAFLMLVPVLNWIGLVALAYLFKNPETEVALAAKPEEIKIAEPKEEVKEEPVAKTETPAEKEEVK